MMSLYTGLCAELTGLGTHFSFDENWAGMQGISGRRGRLICADKRVEGLMFGPSMWVHLGDKNGFYGLWQPRLYRGKRDGKEARVVYEILRGGKAYRKIKPAALSGVFMRKYGLIEMEPG